MQREYVKYAGDACKNGMSPEEVQNLFTMLLDRPILLRTFAKGIGATKKITYTNQASINQNVQAYGQPIQAKSYQYQYFKQ